MADNFRHPEDQFILVGKVTKSHGLRGEVKVFPYSDDVETLLQYANVVLVDNKGKLSPVLEMEKARFQGKTAILKFASINDRNTADALRGMGVLISKDDLPAAAEDEYYWYQFYNLPVFIEDGGRLGRVDSIFSNGAQDIMVVRDKDKEFLIPILDSIIKEHTEKGVIIAPPPGLIDINSGVDG